MATTGQGWRKDLPQGGTHHADELGEWGAFGRAVEANRLGAAGQGEKRYEEVADYTGRVYFIPTQVR